MTPRAHSLDALRLCASLALVIGHLTTDQTFPAALRHLMLGGLSSTLFFVMSGFVVVASPSFWALPSHVTILKRALRLLPPHWLGFAIMVPFAALGADRISTSELTRTLAWWLTGLHDFAPPGAFTVDWNQPAWAITPLLIGGFTLPALKLARINTWSLRTILLLLIPVVILRMAVDLLPAPPPDLNASFPRHAAVFPRLLEILAGAIAAVALYTPSAAGILRRLSRDASFLAILATALLLLVTAQQQGGQPAVYLYTHGLVLPLALALVASAYANNGRVTTLCSRPFIQRGAKISIFIWLLHIPVDMAFKHAAVRLGIPADILFELPAILVSLLLTVLTSLAFEPLLRLIPSPKSTAPPTPETRAHAAG